MTAERELELKRLRDRTLLRAVHPQCLSIEEALEAAYALGVRQAREESVQNLEWIKPLAKELVEANADHGRTYDNAPDYLETAAAIQRHFLMGVLSEESKTAK